MTHPTEQTTPSAEDDIKSVLQETLFQQVQTLLNYTRTDTLQLQIPETDIHIFAGPRTRIAEFIQREIVAPAASFGISAVMTSEYKAAQQRKNEVARSRLDVLGEQTQSPVPRVGGITNNEPVAYGLFAEVDGKMVLQFPTRATEAECVADVGMYVFGPKYEVHALYDAATLASQSQAAQPTNSGLNEAAMNLRALAKSGRELRNTGEYYKLCLHDVVELERVAQLLDNAIAAHLASQSQAAQPTDKARELAAQLRQQHATDSWNWDSLLEAANMIERLAGTSQATNAQAERVAYLHEVVAGDGEPDQALSFAPDNFPLSGTLGYRSISHQPIYLAAPVAKEAIQPLIGKLMDEISQLPVLWGLNEPGALLRNSDVFRVLADAAKQQAHVLPPFAAPAGEHDSAGMVLTDSEIIEVLRKEFDLCSDTMPTEVAMRAGCAVEEEVARRFRAQGGNTNTDSSDRAPTTSTVSAPTDAARDVLAERRRQIEAEGWTPEHDDKYISCELARAAATYATCSHIEQLKLCGEQVWPWHPDWWKRSTYRHDLTKAGALILAEIERLDRDALRTSTDQANADGSAE